MATFVIVHGAWSGGWAWGPVARELRGAGARHLPRTFVRFTAKPPDDPQAPIFDAMAARVRAEDGWTYREVAFDHAPQFTHPRELARLLLELV